MIIKMKEWATSSVRHKRREV